MTARVRRTGVDACPKTRPCPESLIRLVANAVLHAEGPAALRVGWTAGVLRLGAWDAEDGRGLALVRACADQWGRQPLSRNGRRGKLVWCELGAA
ncbi:ATP-binding protein [Streptomyces sp. NBC_01261]|uniref:ATP-binding protein n=1 Tax=Streptomyces sp. NBC_01261 TaxID=2903802 RepID=UPI002E34FEFA|nr:ATP-binding protein [Streptomyces sp. NBC_01261]